MLGNIRNIFNKKDRRSEELDVVKGELQALREDYDQLVVEKRSRAYDENFSTWNIGRNMDVKTGDVYRYGKLSYRELEEIYFASSIVRAIIDSISRTISSLDWKIVDRHQEEGKYDDSTKYMIEKVTNFFINPNINAESFGTLRKKITRDLLIYDAGIIEKVFMKDGSLGELWAKSPKHFSININETGVVRRYVQTMDNRDSVIFSSDEIVYLVFYPSTSSQYGNPVIESLVSEIAASMFGSKLIAKSFEYDELPPGILNLGKIGQVAYDRAKESFKSKREGGRKRFELSVVHDTDKVEWIALDRPPAELQLSELVDKVSRMIFRAFGISPSDMGIENVNRATAMVQENISNSKLIRPLSLLQKEFINSEIIWPCFDSNLSIEFAKPKSDEVQHALELSDRLVHKGVMTINEARNRLSENPVKGGDNLMIISPNVPKGGIYLDSEDGKWKPLVEDIFDSEFNPVSPNAERDENTETGDENVEQEDEKGKEKDKENDEKINETTTKILKSAGDKYIIDVKKALTDQKELNDEYDEVFSKTEKWFLGALAGAFIFGRDKPSNVIDNATKQIYQKMKNTTNDIFKKAFNEGVSVAKKQDPDLEIDGKRMDIILSKRIKEQVGFISDKFLSRFKKRIHEAINKYKLKEPDLKRKERSKVFKNIVRAEAIDKSKRELVNYAYKAWTVWHEGWLSALKYSAKDNYESVDSIRTAGETSCPSCIEQEKSSPYYKTKEGFVSDDGTKLILPGDRECLHNCLCFLAFDKL